MSEQCKALIYDNDRTWDAHQCRNQAATERAVQRLRDGVRRIPVCRLHAKQRRANFVEWRRVEPQP